MVRIGIVGASGYTGAELVRLLALHPSARVVAATSETYAGQPLRNVYAGLGAAGDVVLSALARTELTPRTVDAVFLALPHGEAHALAPGLVSQSLKVVDLSGDFRFPELFREKIAGAAFVSNPGCFVTAAVLALYPLVKAGWVDARTLVVDAKSGLTGAGRKAKTETMYTHAAENVVPYKLAGTHQHTPEMEMALSRAAGREVTLTFTPQMVAARRGILATTYGRLTGARTSAEVAELYAETYRGEPFVTVVPGDGPWPDLAAAVGSNQCVLKAAVDERTGLAVVVAALDNLIKGAAGSAIQNLNLMSGLPEDTGLPLGGFAL
jgi:N-acetyl-gamma-glutamyl-phosphate reductase